LKKQTAQKGRGKKIRPWRQKIRHQKRKKKVRRRFGEVKGLVGIKRNLGKWNG